MFEVTTEVVENHSEFAGASYTRVLMSAPHAGVGIGLTPSMEAVGGFTRLIVRDADGVTADVHFTRDALLQLIQELQRAHAGKLHEPGREYVNTRITDWLVQKMILEDVAQRIADLERAPASVDDDEIVDAELVDDDELVEVDGHTLRVVQEAEGRTVIELVEWLAQFDEDALIGGDVTVITE